MLFNHTHKLTYGYVRYKSVTPITSAKKKTPSGPNDWRQQRYNRIDEAFRQRRIDLAGHKSMAMTKRYDYAREEWYGEPLRR